MAVNFPNWTVLRPGNSEAGEEGPYHCARGRRANSSGGRQRAADQRKDSLSHDPNASSRQPPGHVRAVTFFLLALPLSSVNLPLLAAWIAFSCIFSDPKRVLPIMLSFPMKNLAPTLPSLAAYANFAANARFTGQPLRRTRAASLSRAPH